MPSPASNTNAQPGRLPPQGGADATVRRNLMLGTAGHVDHGKTALVKLMTGCETDTLAEEKERGLTIDLGFAPCRLADQRVAGIVDVPGHVDFIRNMVAGAQGIDLVILVVAADDGIMPQTREHLQILTLMGLRHGLVALTKVDLVDSARREEVTSDLRRLLLGTFLAEAPICPVSTITGEGYGDFFDALNAVVNACPDRRCTGVFRLWVEDVFPIRGAGTVVTGIPASGTVRLGDELTLLPSARARVRRLQVYGQESADARAGECVALNLPDLDLASVKRGKVLADAYSPAPVLFCEGELQVLDSVRGGITDLIEVHVHVGTAAVLGKVALLEADRLAGARRGLVQLRLQEPLPLMVGERFVLRGNVSQDGQSSVMTIGGGRILGLSNTRLRRQKPWTLEKLSNRRAVVDDPKGWCDLMIREAGGPIAEADLPVRCGVRPAELAPLLEDLTAQKRVLRLAGAQMVHMKAVEDKAAVFMATLKEFHARQPQRAGMPKGDWCAAGGPGPLMAGHQLLCEAVAGHLRASGQVDITGDTVSLAGWAARISNPDQALCDQILTFFRQQRFTPPDGPQLCLLLKQPPPKVAKLTQLLIDQGKLVRIDPALVLHRDALEHAKQQALSLFRKQSKFTTMEFRDALAVSRKFAVPVLDYLDKVRFTVRNGHDRTPGAEARKILSA